MGSIYVHVPHQNDWHLLRYPAFDLDAYAAKCYDWEGTRKWKCRYGRSRCVVYAKTLDEAKAKAMSLKGWPDTDLVEIAR